MGVALRINELVASLETSFAPSRLAARQAKCQKSKQWRCIHKCNIFSIRGKKSVTVQAGIEIDRRRHLEESLKRQEVVVDFYNSSCGACKYMLPQFIKLCKRGCSEECIVEEQMGVIYVKHNVLDEYDDTTLKLKL